VSAAEKEIKWDHTKAWPLFLQECTPREKDKALEAIGYGHKTVNLHTFGPDDQRKFRDAVEWLQEHPDGEEPAPPTQPVQPQAPIPKSELHKAALAYADKQWPVFPCVHGTKKPATAHGFYDATTDVDQINKWWTENPEYNVAFCPDDAGLAIIDFDPGSERSADYPETYTVATPRGGFHLYYVGCLPPTTSKLGPHIDTRGVGSYALLAPSVVDGQEYKVIDDRPAVALPTQIEQRLAITADKITTPGTTQLDLPGNVATGRQRLQDLVQQERVAISGRGGNNLTYKVAAELHNLGISPEKSLELLEAEYNLFCSPPWSREELQTIIANSWKYAQNAPGAHANDAPANTFKDAKLPQGEDTLLEDKANAERLERLKQRAGKFPIVYPDQFKDRPRPRWLVRHLLQSNALQIIFGQSETFKTPLALEMCHAIVTGIPAFGRYEVLDPGDVVYVPGEAPDDVMRNRWPATRLQHNQQPYQRTVPGEFVVIEEDCPHPSKTGENPDDFDALIYAIEQRDLNPKAIVIDTLAVAMQGLNEDQAADMGLLLAGAHKVRRRFKCAVIFIHHPTKWHPDMMRGSGRQTNDVDIVWLSIRDDDTFNVRLKAHKMKSFAKPAKPYYFKGQLQDIGEVDEFKQPIKVPVFTAVDGPEVKKKPLHVLVCNVLYDNVCTDGTRPEGRMTINNVAREVWAMLHPGKAWNNKEPDCKKLLNRVENLTRPKKHLADFITRKNGKKFLAFPKGYTFDVDPVHPGEVIDVEAEDDSEG
jgi:hypothetical protein